MCGGWLAALPFVGGELEQANCEEHYNGGGSGRRVGCARVEMADGQAGQAGDDAERVHQEDGGALALKQIGEAVRGVVLARRGEGKEAAA